MEGEVSIASWRGISGVAITEYADVLNVRDEEAMDPDPTECKSKKEEEEEKKTGEH